MSVSAETAIKNLTMMLTIRRAEEKVISFATEHTGLIRGHYHVYIGQPPFSTHEDTLRKSKRSSTPLVAH